MLFAENSSVFASMLQIEVNRSGLTFSTVTSVRLNALHSCNNCTMDVVALQTPNKTTHCTTDLNACFASTFSTRRRLLGNTVFINILVVSRGLFTPIFNVTCPSPCISYNAQANAPVTYASTSTREDFVNAVASYFTVSPPEPPTAQGFPVVIIAVLGASAGLMVVVVSVGVVRLRQIRNSKTPLPVRHVQTMLDAVRISDSAGRKFE